MGNKGFGAFIAGGVIGAALALLYAPRKGEETRALVCDRVNTVWGDAQEMGAQAAGNAQQFYQEASAKGQEVYSAASTRVQEAANNIKPVFSEKNDELREKIEVARQRIAMQVAKNAEAAHDAVADKIPVAADAAQNAATRAHSALDSVAEKLAGDKPEASPAEAIEAAAPVVAAEAIAADVPEDKKED